MSRQYIEKAKARQRFNMPTLGRFQEGPGQSNVPCLNWGNNKPDESILDIVRRYGFKWSWESRIWHLPAGYSTGLDQPAESHAGDCFREIQEYIDEVAKVGVAAALGRARARSAMDDKAVALGYMDRSIDPGYSGPKQFRVSRPTQGVLTTTNKRPYESELAQEFGPGTYKIVEYRPNHQGAWCYYKSETVKVAGFPTPGTVGPAPLPHQEKAMAADYLGLHGNKTKQRLDEVAGKYRDTLAQVRDKLKVAERTLTAANIDLTFQQNSLDKKDAEIAVLRSELGERYQGAAAKAEPVKPKGVVINCQGEEDY